MLWNRTDGGYDKQALACACKRTTTLDLQTSSNRQESSSSRNSSNPKATLPCHLNREIYNKQLLIFVDVQNYVLPSISEPGISEQRSEHPHCYKKWGTNHWYKRPPSLLSRKSHPLLPSRGRRRCAINMEMISSSPSHELTSARKPGTIDC